MNATLSDLLKKMLELNGSDLHISTNSPPQVRVHGHLQPLDMPMLNPSETKQLAYSVLTDAQKHRFEEHLELDFSFGLKGLARFRGNVFNQRGATGAVFRVIPFEIKSFQQLNLPPIVSKLCEKPRGFAPTYRSCWKACFANRSCRRSADKAARAPWRSWCRTRRFAIWSEKTRFTRSIPQCNPVRINTECRPSTSLWPACISANRSRWKRRCC